MSSLDSVIRPAFTALYVTTGPEGRSQASILGQVVPFGRGRKVGFQYQLSLPSEPFC